MKLKALISFAVTAKLICVFVFAFAKSRFSHDKAHLVMCPKDSDIRKNSGDPQHPALPLIIMLTK